MSSSDEMSLPAPRTTVTLVTGERYRVEGDPKDVERTILDAARGSIMELAWLIEADSGARLGVNPEHVVLVRVADLESGD